MYEIRVHGRGGQGAVTTAELIAIAAFYDGKKSQAFPNFGVERRGAPVLAYARLDDSFINVRSHVYSPTHVIVLDSSLLTALDVTRGLKEGGTLLINTSKSPQELGIKGRYKICTIDATRIAYEVFGKAIVNTAILGTFAKEMGLITAGALEKAIDQKFSGKKSELNKQIIDRIEHCNAQMLDLTEGADISAAPEVCSYEGCTKPEITKAGVIYEPGSSAKNKTGGWREGRKPVRDKEKCINCHMCWMMCPDNAIDENIETDYDYCKGCGICAEVCPVKCIEMKEEER